MNPLQDLLSSIDPTTARAFPAKPPVQRLVSGSPNPTAAQRPATPANGTSETPALKRKASGAVDAAQSKIARRDAPPPLQTNGAARAGSGPAVSRSNSTTPTNVMPYRGTAGLGASKPTGAQAKRPPSSSTGQVGAAKAASSTPKSPAPKPAGAAVTAAPAKKVGGYLAMLQKAKEKEATKPAAPPLKHEPTRIMTKKDREQARLAAKAVGKGKKAGPITPARISDAKAETANEKRKPTDLGYQGTARPAKKPVEVGYKGTARPMATTAAPAARAGAAPAAAKKKAKPPQDRYSGYAAWSDLDEMDDDDQEDDYDSDASSDMEGGIWDVEEEEAKALRAAKREDAEALAEENELKRAKEERKRKLAAMNKAAAAKRKY